MSEEKAKSKTPAIAKRILKRIGLGLLILLLIAALVFQAPWKVITLLVIILAACTILPKTLRKWFWAGVGAAVIALVIWVFMPDEVEGWQPYRFDEELAALEAKYAIPDEENAATIYTQLLEDYNEAAFEPNFLDPNLVNLTQKEPWSSKDYPEIAAWLQQHRATIATLLKAAEIKKCRFPIAANIWSLDQQMRRSASMRHWTSLLSCAANNDVCENRIEQALEKYLALIQMGNHICQQSTIVDMLNGIGFERLATNSLNRFVVTGDATEEHLNVIERALAKIEHDWGSDLPKFIENEKLMLKSMFGLFYEINSNGKVKLSRDPTAGLKTLSSEDVPVPPYWGKKLMKASVILAWFFMPATPQKAAKIIDDSFKKLYAMAEPDFNWPKEHPEPSSWIKLNFRFMIESLAGIVEAPFYEIHDLYLRCNSNKRCARIIIALRRYKNNNSRWPENLEEIKSFASPEAFVDPINNSSFVYKLTEKDFTLYSKGTNNIDENGQYNSRWPGKAEPDDRLIWPANSCEDKDEKEDEQQ